MPLFRRFGRPGLIGTAARTAVIAGTASATAGAVRRYQTTRAEQSFEQQQLADAEHQRQLEAAARQAVTQQQSGATEPERRPGLVDELQQLAALHSGGVLDDAEFAAAKMRLLDTGHV